MTLVNFSKLAFRTAGAAFVAVWLFNLATTSLQFSSCEDLKDAAFQAEMEKRAVEWVKRQRSPSVLESQGSNARYNIRESKRGNGDRPT
jgi:hypothetical protein